MILYILYLYMVVGAVWGKRNHVILAVDADTIVRGVKAAMRSDYFKGLADDFGTKAALYLFEVLEKNKRAKSRELHQTKNKKHSVGRAGSTPDFDHRDTKHLPLEISLLSNPQTPPHNIPNNDDSKQKKSFSLEIDSNIEIPSKKEEQLMNLLKEPSPDGDYPDREAELTDYEFKKNVKPVRTQEMINGKRFRAKY